MEKVLFRKFQKQQKQKIVHVFFCIISSFPEIDECISAPCQNGATCLQPQPDMYYCQCVPGWEGNNCERGKVIGHQVIVHKVIGHSLQSMSE